jgi:hypothetical protein
LKKIAHFTDIVNGPAGLVHLKFCGKSADTNDGVGRTGRVGLNVPSALPGNLPVQPPSGFTSHTGI